MKSGRSRLAAANGGPPGSATSAGPPRHSAVRAHRTRADHSTPLCAALQPLCSLRQGGHAARCASQDTAHDKRGSTVVGTMDIRY